MQVEHKTEKGTILFILAPKEATGYKIIERPCLSIEFDIKYGVDKEYLDIPNGFNLIGLTGEVAEEICFNMGFESSIHILDWPKNSDSPIVKEVNGLDEFKKVIKIKNIQQPSVVLFKPNEK